MYTVEIYDTHKKIFKTYQNIHTIKYFTVLQKWKSVTGDKILTHAFPAFCSYQLLGDNCNYCIDKSIVGSIGIERID